MRRNEWYTFVGCIAMRRKLILALRRTFHEYCQFKTTFNLTSICPSPKLLDQKFWVPKSSLLKAIQHQQLGICHLQIKIVPHRIKNEGYLNYHLAGELYDMHISFLFVHLCLFSRRKCSRDLKYNFHFNP